MHSNASERVCAFPILRGVTRHELFQEICKMKKNLFGFLLHTCSIRVLLSERIIVSVFVLLFFSIFTNNRIIGAV